MPRSYYVFNTDAVFFPLNIFGPLMVQSVFAYFYIRVLQSNFVY